MSRLALTPATRAAPPLAFFFAALVGGCVGRAGGSALHPQVPSVGSPRPGAARRGGAPTQALIRARPENPPAASAAVEVLAARLRAAGIEPELRAFAGDERVNLLAVLPGKNRALPPLLLMGHSDVVPADAADWSSPPWEGALVGDRLVGRGTTDMLGMVALQTLTLVALKSAALPLERDVVLLVEGDEEVEGKGVQAALRDWPAVRGAWVALTEGGFLLESYLRAGEDLAAITVAEKGILQVTLSARGPAGHGSVPLPDAAPDRVVRAVARVLDREVPSHHGARASAAAALGEQRGGLRGWC